MNLTSSAFQPFADIPKHCTCEGADLSPPLSWTEVPAQAKSLVLIIDDPDAPDPDAPKMTWVHWVLYNIPPNTTGLNSGTDDLPTGTLSGLNDAQETSYHGPCPPVGRHRYFHKLYALDTILPNLHYPTKAILEKAMQGHVIAQCELIATYKKGA
jgi:Raf kinase inhibitor-like YbhB/YbcL family protein